MIHPLRDPHPDDPSRIPLAQRQPDPIDHTAGGRKECQYSAATARIILARLEGGQTVRQVAADPLMPSYRTIYDWRARHADFADAWDEMRSDIAHFRRRKVAEREAWRATLAAARAREAGRPPPAKRGRKSTYAPAVGRALCRLIVLGLSTRAACERLQGRVSAQRLYRWLRNHSDFRADYLAAVEERDARLSDAVMLEVDAATPANLPLARRRVKRMQAAVAAVRPHVWRWD